MKDKIKEEICTIHFRNDDYDIRFSDLPKDIQENDIIEIEREEGYYSENESYDGYTRLVIYS